MQGSKPAVSGPEPTDILLRIEKPVYGGDALAHTIAGEVAFVPFALPGELVAPGQAAASHAGLHVLEASPERVQPRCVHFGVCGGCQYQMASYDLQLRMKTEILQETLTRAGLSGLPELRVWGSPEPYAYRNRVRMRLRDQNGALRVGYSRRGTQEFLPISMCPIAAPVLWASAEATMHAAQENPGASQWLRSAAELEIACSADERRVLVHLLCPGAVPKDTKGLERLAGLLASSGLPITSVGASRLHVASGRATGTLASFGANGIPYQVGEDTFWLERGSFFQVNRFLVPVMVKLVCGERSGALAWDLYAGVGLFARALAGRFERVTAVEANPTAAAELRRGLRRSGDQAVAETTLNFLRRAVLERDRPQLIVLDPPRAGAGDEVCRLLARVAAPEIVYVSCDPSTLGRDLAVLTAAGYRVAELDIIDLFPQTYHLETVIVLRRTA